MPAAVYVLFGAFFTIAASFGLGALLLQRLRLKLYREEQFLFAFLCGSALLSLVVFCFAAAHLVYKGVFLVTGLLIIAAAIRTRAYRFDSPRLPALGRGWTVLFWSLYTIFGVLYFFSAMAPEHSPDGMTYHLGLVGRYYREHGFHLIATNMYAGLSQAMEMLFLFAFAFGRHSAAAMVHCAFLMSFPLMMLAWGRRFGVPVAGVTGGLLVYLSPVVGVTGTSAYNDVAAAVAVFAVFYLLEVWSEQRESRLLVAVGLLAGFCYALKYPAGIAIPFALCWIAWKSRDVRAVVITGACASLLVFPWMTKDAILVHNPVAPFANRLFPNRYMMPGDEESYSRDMRNFNEVRYSEIPVEVTTGGQRLGGLVGPAFLLLPLSLLALRFRQGRLLLFCGVLFTATYFMNTSTRFLIQGLPFWSLALGLVLAQAPQAAVVLIVAHGLASWPPFLSKYSAPYAWRLDRIATRPALRKISEERYLTEHARGYILARMIEEHVPAGQRVFSFGGITAEAYTSREVVVGFQAAFNHRVRDLLLTPLIKEFQGTRWQEFRFPPQTARKIRVVQTNGGAPDYWSVSELRVFSQGRELPRAPEWRLTARPNPWAVQSAFDNSPITRWRSGEPIRPGMYIEVDFGKPETVDSVRVESSHDQYKVHMRIDALAPKGEWRTVSAEAEDSNGPEYGGVRRAATAEVKAAGVSYILIDEVDFGSADFIDRPSLWGLKQVDEKAGGHLFHIE